MESASQATGVSKFTIKLKLEMKFQFWIKLTHTYPTDREQPGSEFGGMRGYEVLDETKVLRTPGKHSKRPIHRNCEIDDFDKCFIRQTIQYFYIQQKKTPSLRKLLLC
ncbi:hypothetical protein AVEN_244932-1 [Araneus ventricosus]|uniref:Uncharacterized protein n=1 Tax=Araneus ventricosus TaxID=182803 RepID=A0A4Y2F9A0_ARAVE|nr:hypothetical protein AVEN_244932-1 [Araneus ventricosus]